MAFQLSDLSGLYDQVSGYMTASQNAGNVNGIAAAQQGALNGQYSSLQQQLANATRQYSTDRSNLDQTNAGLTAQMGNIQSQIAGLSDPNSAYMQQARQGIERKDAAAGRNSQWGDREVQLAALLAENASKYAPGLQAQYTSAANSMADNEAKLNRQYQDALNGFNTQYLGLIGAGNAAATTANGTQQSANNQRANAAGNAGRSGLELGRLALGSLFGNNAPDSMSDWSTGQLGTGSLTDTWNTGGGLYGSGLGTGFGNVFGITDIGSFGSLGDMGYGGGYGGSTFSAPSGGFGGYGSSSYSLPTGGGGILGAMAGNGGWDSSGFDSYW